MQPLSCLLLQRHSLHPRLSFQPGAVGANEVNECYAPELKSLKPVMMIAKHLTGFRDFNEALN